MPNMAWHEVFDIDELAEGTRRIIQIEGRISIGVFNVGGILVAFRNRCPHAGAPVCEGTLSGAIVSDQPFQRHLDHEGRILKCPWHALEFQLPEGVTLTQPAFRLIQHPVSLDGAKVMVEVEPAVRRAHAEETT
jgi:nitrite reductase/ring-hydroxylating ferredoxin subunit